MPGFSLTYSTRPLTKIFVKLASLGLAVEMLKMSATSMESASAQTSASVAEPSLTHESFAAAAAGSRLKADVSLAAYSVPAERSRAWFATYMK